MCAGAILHARLRRVIYAVADPKTGAAGSVINLFAAAQPPNPSHLVCACQRCRYRPANRQRRPSALGFFRQRRQPKQQKPATRPSRPARQRPAPLPQPLRPHPRPASALQPFSPGHYCRASKQHATPQTPLPQTTPAPTPPTPSGAALHRHRPPAPPAPAPHHTPAAWLRQLPPAMGRHHRTATPSRLARTG